MITREELIPYILQQFPGFTEAWTAYIAYWGESPGISLEASEFGRYISDLARAGHAGEVEKAFQMAEDLLHQGDERVKNAVATCFLEHFQNTEVQSELWIQYLGPESLAYCKAWDEFTGVKTPGLW